MRQLGHRLLNDSITQMLRHDRHHSRTALSSMKDHARLTNGSHENCNKCYNRINSIYE